MTVGGLLHLSNLAISLPGPVELKFTLLPSSTPDPPTTTTTTAGGGGAGPGKRATLGLFYVTVLADPSAPAHGAVQFCTFAFRVRPVLVLVCASCVLLGGMGTLCRCLNVHTVTGARTQ